MLAIDFIILTVAMAALLIVVLYKAAIKIEVQRKLLPAVILVLVAWLTYIGITSKNGLFLVGGLPPRIPLGLVFPAMLMIAAFVVSGKNKKLITAISHPLIIALQSFRIVVEVLLWKGAVQGIVPEEGTFTGYNFDIVIGLVALPVALLAFRKGKPNKKLLYVFNFSGLATLAIVVFIFISRAYSPSLWHRSDNIILNGFGQYPYTFLPGFLMPLAVFMHILSLKKLRRDDIS